jgi:hypothetical protein
VYDQLRARPLDRVRGVHVGVPDELTVLADVEVDGRLVAALADMQHDVLGQRERPVRVAGRLSQVEDLGNLVRREMGGTANRRGRGHLPTVSATR